jgi:hypothetical protein
MRYYLGAYYLLQLRKVEYRNIKDHTIYTCSTCINTSYLDDWALSWTVNGQANCKEKNTNLQLGLTHIEAIQKWADQKFEDKKIGWITTFADFDTLMEYKTKFFGDILDYKILSINFSESERNSLLEIFEVKEKNIGSIGLWENLEKGIVEAEDESETELGFDLIGIESSGDFHTFHCHDLADDLVDKFGIKINEFGLIDKVFDSAVIIDYMNDEANGFEPVPWFLVKVKAIDEKKKSLFYNH